ncbi:MAG: 50S ribosomal protein L11 methyltransferase [Miniphocaeibacter sp.]|uniref:50S ribosomal protein L11 methyltransferase n=1 Tax=Miniphocaeibacter sp. TaxID=3100973 RepID=UPI0017ED55F4|nr:50S ribosomal protein L11 methyltransferase [Gallicola sp.]
MLETNRWSEIIINTPKDFEDIIYSILYDYNISTFEIIDYRTMDEIKETKPYWVELQDDLIPKYELITIKLYLSESEFDEKKILDLKNSLINLDKAIEFNVNNKIKDKDWSEEWKKFYKPFKVGERVIIKPSWEEYKSKENNVIINIDPGMAFGTGTHESTYLCIEELQNIGLKNKKVCDIGCGSGILSIVAAKLGANRVTAIDIDPISVKTTKENSILNHTNSVISVYEGDLLNTVSENYDIFIANILPNVILDLIPNVGKVINDNGLIITSGIIKEKSNLIVSKLQEYNFEIVNITNKGEWVCILAKYNA